MRHNSGRILTLVALIALAATAGEAQVIEGHSGPGFLAGYNDGDLILAFISSSDASQTSGVDSFGDVLFNLGPASNFTGLTPGTYSVAGFDGSTSPGQGSPGWGGGEINLSITVPSGSTFWTVMGSDSISNDLWLTGETAQTRASASTQSTLVSIIEDIGLAGAGNANSNGSAYDPSQTTGNYLSASQAWQNFPATAAIPVSSPSSTLGLYKLSPGTGSAGSATELGYFTLSDSNGTPSLTFTVPSGQGPTPPSSGARLANISSRAFVGAGAELEIAGFVISGPPGSTEQVLLRGVGPTLTGFGVSGALANPVLNLYDSSGSLLASNTGWTTSPDASSIAAAASATGAFALPPGSADSAMLVELAPGAYTAQIDSANGATGVALAEVYEVGAGSAELVNISTRAFVGAGSDVEIGGFYISGAQSETVLVRAVGPTLAGFGVGGSLAQPVLTVVDSAGNTVATNTGWSNNADAASVTLAAMATGAFPLTTGSADCALLLTLAPGAYTAVVSSDGGATGIALVEVYENP